MNNSNKLNDLQHACRIVAEVGALLSSLRVELNSRCEDVSKAIKGEADFHSPEWETQWSAAWIALMKQRNEHGACATTRQG